MPRFDRYIVWPRPMGDGWSLTGPGLPYPLWHRRDDYAIEHARWLLRDMEVGCIWLLDSSGYPIFCETVRGTVPQHLGG